MMAFFYSKKEVNLLHKKIEKLSMLAKFPFANPNIVFNIDHNKTVHYFNPVAEKWLKGQGDATADHLLALLPENIMESLDCINSEESVIEGESLFGQCIYAFKITKFNDLLFY